MIDRYRSCSKFALEAVSRISCCPESRSKWSAQMLFSYYIHAACATVVATQRELKFTSHIDAVICTMQCSVSVHPGLLFLTFVLTVHWFEMFKEGLKRCPRVTEDQWMQHMWSWIVCVRPWSESRVSVKRAVFMTGMLVNMLICNATSPPPAPPKIKKDCKWVPFYFSLMSDNATIMDIHVVFLICLSVFLLPVQPGEDMWGIWQWDCHDESRLQRALSQGSSRSVWKPQNQSEPLQSLTEGVKDE